MIGSKMLLWLITPDITKSQKLQNLFYLIWVRIFWVASTYNSAPAAVFPHLSSKRRNPFASAKNDEDEDDDCDEDERDEDEHDAKEDEQDERFDGRTDAQSERDEDAKMAFPEARSSAVEAAVVDAVVVNDVTVGFDAAVVVVDVDVVAVDIYRW